jgi:hypothetical protein
VRRAARFEARVQDGEVIVNAQGGGPTGQRLRYSVAWEPNQFGAAQPGTSFRHRFDHGGAKEISVRAIDPRWGTERKETRTVVVP